MEIPDISSCSDIRFVTVVTPRVDIPLTLKFLLTSKSVIVDNPEEFTLPVTFPAITPDIFPVTLPVKSPTNPVAVTIPDALTSPKELIPTPFCPELTSLPTCSVNIAAVVAIPTLPPVLYILLTPAPTIVSSHCDVGRFNRFIPSPKNVIIPELAVIIPLFILTPAPIISVGLSVVIVATPA